MPSAPVSSACCSSPRVLPAVAIRYLHEIYWPAFDDEFALPAQASGSLFAPLLRSISKRCSARQLERTAGNEHWGRSLQIPAKGHPGRRIHYSKSGCTAVQTDTWAVFRPAESSRPTILRATWKSRKGQVSAAAQEAVLIGFQESGLVHLLQNWRIQFVTNTVFSRLFYWQLKDSTGRHRPIRMLASRRYKSAKV